MSTEELALAQVSFVNEVLPLVEKRASFTFTCFQHATQEDARQEARRLAWQRYRWYRARGREIPKRLLAKYAVLDAFRAQLAARKRLPLFVGLVPSCRATIERPDFELDFEAWVETLSRRQQRIVQLLAEGYSACETAGQVGATRRTVDRWRSLCQQSYQNFFAV